MRTPVVTKRSSGRTTVTYRDVKGVTHDAVVLGGTGTALDLFVPALPKAVQRKTAVAKATGVKQTNVWIAH